MTEPKTVLVADDSPLIVDIMSHMLSSMGLNVQVATDGI